MEYRKGRCPKCNEVMQIPTDRDKIICMFCGSEFSAEESLKLGNEAYQEKLCFLQANVLSLFQNFEAISTRFSRKLYEQSFQDYLTDFADFFKSVYSAVDLSVDKALAQNEIAGLIISEAQKIIDQQKKRIDKENKQLSLNMYMVTFVIPAILSMEGKDMKDLADVICKVWAGTFKGSNIQAADYANIKSGFRTKLCYITTAVCESLHKPADCYELSLLKNYRDQYLLSKEGGEELVRRYYDIAPTIVKRISKRNDAEETYLKIWAEYLKPCISLIEENRNEECQDMYTDMVNSLFKEYMEDCHES